MPHSINCPARQRARGAITNPKDDHKDEARTGRMEMLDRKGDGRGCIRDRAIKTLTLTLPAVVVPIIYKPEARETNRCG